MRFAKKEQSPIVERSEEISALFIAGETIEDPLPRASSLIVESLEKKCRLTSQMYEIQFSKERLYGRGGRPCAVQHDQVVGTLRRQALNHRERPTRNPIRAFLRCDLRERTAGLVFDQSIDFCEGKTCSSREGSTDSS